jgi:hypothetical protein
LNPVDFINSLFYRPFWTTSLPQKGMAGGHGLCGEFPPKHFKVFLFIFVTKNTYWSNVLLRIE